MTIDELIAWCQRLREEAERFNEELKTWQNPNMAFGDAVQNAYNLSGGTAAGLRRVESWLTTARKEAGGE